MPRGRKSNGATSLSNAERQARYRARHHQVEPSVVIRTRQPVDRRPRPRRWHDAVTERVELQAALCRPGSKPCPTRFEAPRPPRRFRSSSMLISTRWPRSSRRAATAATDEMQWFRRMHGRPMMLGENDGLKGCAAHTGKRRLRPLTPSPSPQRLAVMPFHVGCVRRQGSVMSTGHAVTFLSGTRVTYLSVTYTSVPAFGRYGKSAWLG